MGRRTREQPQPTRDSRLPGRGIDRIAVSIVERLPGPVRSALGGMLQSSIVALLAGFMLLFGGIFLAVAWATGPQPLMDSYRYVPFTERTEGRIVESWIALEFDPDDLPKDKLYWQALSKVSPCVVVEYSGEHGAAARRAFCGNRFQFREDFRVDDWTSMAPGVPFGFVRDASGFAIEELRMSKRALDWISTHPPRSTFMLSKPPPGTALGALKEQFDAPLDVALASWTTALPPFPLAFDPRHPDQPMPAALADERRRGFWWGGLIFTLLLAVPGVAVWRIGIGWLSGQSGTVLWLLTLLPLLALPWWSDFLPKLLRHVNADWAQIGSDMLDDVNRITRFSAGAPGEATLAGGERLVWRVEAGAYADTFGRIRFSLPQPRPADANAALAALRAQAAAQVRAWDSASRTALFKRLREHYESFARGVQGVFTSAAEETLRDAAADADAHRAARQFLIFGTAGNYYEDQLDALEKAASPPR